MSATTLKLLSCTAIAIAALTTNANFRSVYVNGDFEKQHEDKKTHNLVPESWDITFSKNGCCQLVDEAVNGKHSLALKEATACSKQIFPVKRDSKVIVSFSIKGKADSLIILLTGLDARKKYLSMLRRSIENLDTKGKWQHMTLTFDLPAMSDEYGRGIAYIGRLSFGGVGTDFLLDNVELKADIPDEKIYNVEMTDTPKDKRYETEKKK